MRSSANTETAIYLLEKNLDDLCVECRNWLSDIHFRDAELHFLQQLLSRNRWLSRNKMDDTTMSDLENKLALLKKRVTDSVKQELEDHNRYLARLLDEKNVYIDAEYRDKHLALASNMEVTDKKLKTFKREIFSFMEELL